MGFDANPTIYALDFSATPYEGLQVRVRRGSVQIRSDYDQATTWREQLSIFAQVLIEWNLEEGGQPLPLTVDGLHAAEDTVVEAMLNAWISAGRPLAPLEQPSTSGENSSEPPSDEVTTEVERLLPMESLAS